MEKQLTAQPLLGRARDGYSLYNTTVGSGATRVRQWMKLTCENPDRVIVIHVERRIKTI